MTQAKASAASGVLAVAGFECQLDGGGFAACTSPKSYTGLAAGSHNFEVRAVDAASNPDPTPAFWSWTIDLASPAVAIDQAAGQADPTATSPIHFTAVFSEPVTGFDGNDVTLAGSAGATTALVTETAPNDGTTYDIAVSGMAATGTVTANIPAGAAADAATNLSAASTSTDNSVTFTGPTVVTIASARTSRTSKGVLLRWRTGTEADLLGFHVYRSRGHSWQRITHSLIAAQGSVSGASYRFLDQSARRGVSYRYRIKAFSRDGTATWFGPVRVT